MPAQAAERAMSQQPSRERPCSISFGFGRTALGFWVASLAGFVGYGHLVAGIAASGMDGGPAPMGEAATTALALGLAGAVVLGAPAALLFGGVMWRIRRSAAWPAAIATGAALSAALIVPFSAFASALADWGCAREPGLFVVAAAATMMAGSVTGALVGRNGPALAVARRTR
jgi:hypothetical protein